MNQEIEINFIKKFQNIGNNEQNYITKIMTYLSAPFHSKLYILIIFSLYIF